MARIAKSLSALRSEFNAFAPHRATGRDGWIGDAAHASRASRHNPNKFDVVCALDVTHDPASGVDVHKYARLYVATILRLGNEAAPDLEYIISNKEVASRERGWAWRKYTGADDHVLHAHFGVGRGPDSEPTAPYDDIYSWHVADLLRPAAPSPEEDDSMPYSRDEIKAMFRETLDDLTPAENPGGFADYLQYLKTTIEENLRVEHVDLSEDRADRAKP